MWERRTSMFPVLDTNLCNYIKYQSRAMHKRYIFVIVVSLLPRNKIKSLIRITLSSKLWFSILFIHFPWIALYLFKTLRGYFWKWLTQNAQNVNGIVHVVATTQKWHGQCSAWLLCQSFKEARVSKGIELIQSGFCLQSCLELESGRWIKEVVSLMSRPSEIL